MKLSIHLISHPIIQNLSSSIINQDSSLFKRNQILKQLGMLMTYEAVRNWLKIYRVTIRQIKQNKEVTVIDPKESHIIIFNNLKYVSLFYNAQELIPRNSLTLINENEINKRKKEIQFPKINEHTKIIIMVEKAKPEYILNLLNYLTKTKNIKLKQIRLTCMACSTSQLINIGQEYAKLNVYTTQITQN